MALSKTYPAAEFRESLSPNKKKPRWSGASFPADAAPQARLAFARDRPARQLRGTFTDVGAFNKQEIAEAIVSEFPEFGPHLPPKRSIYKPESARMSMFDAAALALTYYFFENGGKA